MDHHLLKVDADMDNMSSFAETDEDDDVQILPGEHQK